MPLTLNQQSCFSQRFALCAMRYATKGLGDFFSKGVGLFVKLSEAVEFGEVFNLYYDVVSHIYVISFIGLVSRIGFICFFN